MKFMMDEIIDQDIKEKKYYYSFKKSTVIIWAVVLLIALIFEL